MTPTAKQITAERIKIMANITSGTLCSHFCFRHGQSSETALLRWVILDKLHLGNGRISRIRIRRNRMSTAQDMPCIHVLELMMAEKQKKSAYMNITKCLSLCSPTHWFIPITTRYNGFNLWLLHLDIRTLKRNLTTWNSCRLGKLTGQWWSYFSTHLLHIRQWCAL